MSSKRTPPGITKRRGVAVAMVLVLGGVLLYSLAKNKQSGPIPGSSNSPSVGYLPSIYDAYNGEPLQASITYNEPCPDCGVTHEQGDQYFVFDDGLSPSPLEF